MTTYSSLEAKPFNAFSDLEFNTHPMGKGVQALHKLHNNIVVSVVGGPSGFYGDGEESFEMAAFDNDGNFIALSDGDDVLAWLSKEEVELEIQKLAGQGA